MTERMHTTMESHPDVLEMRERFVLAERAAATQRGQAIEAMALITGLYMAASPWIAGFNGFTTLAVNNLIAGIAYALLMSGFGHAYERTHARAWAAALIGIWMIVSPWVVAGNVDTTRSITSNIVAGAVGLVLALMAAAANRTGGRRGNRAAGMMGR
ncbi:SPW repeat protein [Streptomyces sp. NBC_01171]|uniref:SPW repeat protein n=1 Tax=Streptomyces sp. NBC_01171 TaxID=2903757 RepID=UPI00386B2452|nr:SPW repeat protein [Streptomyces sp. NBC_01171]